MKTDNGKIIEATTAELYERWLNQGLENIMTFPEYLRTMENAGCVVRGGGGVQNADAYKK